MLEYIYKTIISPAVLYGQEVSSVTLKEKHRLRALENRVLREIFEPHITREWIKLYYEEFPDAYCSPCVLQVRK